MKTSTKKITAALAAVVLVGSLAACSGNADYQERKDSQKQTTLTDSQALRNLEEKRDRENDPNKVRYLYVMSFGQIVGYYVTKGNITSNAAQIAPEDDIVDPCASSYCLSKAAGYNADARSYLSEDFRAADLPAQIDPNLSTTDCKE